MSTTVRKGPLRDRLPGRWAARRPTASSTPTCGQHGGRESRLASRGVLLTRQAPSNRRGTRTRRCADLPTMPRSRRTRRAVRHVVPPLRRTWSTARSRVRPTAKRAATRRGTWRLVRELPRDGSRADRLEVRPERGSRRGGPRSTRTIGGTRTSPGVRRGRNFSLAPARPRSPPCQSLAFLLQRPKRMKRAFKQRCLTEHPDHGGTDARFAALVNVRDRALAAVR